MTEQSNEKKSLKNILKANTFSRNVAVPGLALLLALTVACKGLAAKRKT